MKLGQHWDDLAPWFHRFDGVIALLIVAGVAAIIYNRVRGIMAAPQSDAAGE